MNAADTLLVSCLHFTRRSCHVRYPFCCVFCVFAAQCPWPGTGQFAGWRGTDGEQRLRQGGLIGLLQLVVGGIAVARGVSGHCSTKAWWQRHRQEYHRLRSDIERSAVELEALKASAKAATRGVTVTGKDPLADS